MYNETKPTKLTLEHGSGKMSWEGPWDASLNDIMEGFIGCLRGITFGDWVVKSIKEWCEANLPEENTQEEN